MNEGMDHSLILFSFTETPGYGGGYGKPEYGEYDQMYFLA
jgi:hypothetical protein